MPKGKNNMLPYFLLIIYVLLSSLGMILVKKGGRNTTIGFDNKKLELSITWFVVIGLIMYILSFILWIVILQLFPLSYISPIAYGLVFISISIFSYYILGIKITKEQLVGGVFIIIGIIIGSSK